MLLHIFIYILSQNNYHLDSRCMSQSSWIVCKNCSLRMCLSREHIVLSLFGSREHTIHLHIDRRQGCYSVNGMLYIASLPYYKRHMLLNCRCRCRFECRRDKKVYRCHQHCRMCTLPELLYTMRKYLQLWESYQLYSCCSVVDSRFPCSRQSSY